MMNDALAILDKLYLWQVTLFLSLILLMLGFTGEGITGIEITEGKEDLAIVAGLAFMAVSVLLKYVPPPERRRNGRPKVAVSAQQVGLASRFTEWVDFDDAAKVLIPDHKLPLKALKLKNVELRLELATLQGLLMRRVDEFGKHQLRYRYDDETTFTQ